jgi:small subunit ribosomal protein S8
MSQDIVSDALNRMMNAKRVGKTEVTIRRTSKVLVKLLEIMKSKGHITFELVEDDKKPSINVKFVKLNLCKSIKPRYNVEVADIDKYLRRFLPSRNFGTIVISTNKGLLTQDEAYENKIGGCLIAYFY